MKPENILIDEEKHAKVADFGISALMKVEDQKDHLASEKVVSLFLSPQLLQGSDEYDEKVDVYAFGMIMYFMLTKGKLPHIKIDEVVDGKSIQIPKSINKVSYSIIKKCLAFLPKDRPSFKAITQTIAKYDFKLIDGVESKIADIKKRVKPILNKKHSK